MKLNEKCYFSTLCKAWLAVLGSLHTGLLLLLLIPPIRCRIQPGAMRVILILTVLIWIIGVSYVIHRKNLIKKYYNQYRSGSHLEDFFQKRWMVSREVDELFFILSEKLSKERYLNLAKKQAQYLALQNQINPHFLYNTLECIRSEAIASGVAGVASMTEALATFFRYTISNLDRLVTLEDELTNVENYYVIQQYRFGERLKINIEYDHEENLSILELFMPKLILQPIVENSIYHGLEPKIGKGLVRIKIGRTNKFLMIRIMDNGVGMVKDILDALNNKLLCGALTELDQEEKKGGIAVQNVNNRIKLLCGEEYGIHINSMENLGTDVEITLPIIKKQESVVTVNRNSEETNEKRSFEDGKCYRM